MTNATSVVVRAVLSMVVALLIAWVDEPLIGHDLAWWVCMLIGLVVVFGGWLILFIDD